jgi:hypothetical protein
LPIAKHPIDQGSFTEEFAYIFLRAFFKIMLDLHIIFNNPIIFNAKSLQTISMLLMFTQLILTWRLEKLDLS